MEVDTQVILGLWSGLLTVLITGVAWMVNRIFKLLDDLRKEDTLLREHLSSTYVRRDDFRDFAMELRAILERIEKKIEHKADK